MSADYKLIDLSPRNILNYLIRIEGAIQRDSFTPYVPKYAIVSYPVTNEVLVEETNHMLDFVGLNGYTADVTLCKIENNAAGYIESANDIYERAVHIKVSDVYKEKWNCCLAILAHEICHKLLASRGIYENDTNTNETFVDLSTIYVGFGHLILDGYTTSENKQIIGYLNINNYKIVQHIVNVIYGHERCCNTGLHEIDFLVDEALTIWEKSESEYSLMKHCFTGCERQMSEFHRNLVLLEQIVKACKQVMISDYARYDNLFFNSINECDGNYKNKLSAFGILYDLIAKESYPKPKINTHLLNLNKIVNNALFDLYQTYQGRGVIELKYDFECPKCGRTMKNDQKIVNRNTIVRCPKCGCHYYYFGENWNFSTRQREIREEKIRANAEVEKLVAQKAKSYEIIAEDRITEVRRAAKSKIDKIERDAQKSIEEIRQQEQKRYKELVLQRMPIVLQWLFKKYW